MQVSLFSAQKPHKQFHQELGNCCIFSNILYIRVSACMCAWMFMSAPLHSIITSYFREQGPGPILRGTTGKEAESMGGGEGGKSGGDRGAIGDLSLQIGTTETFPNRMWLWFLTSFHSQLSDRFLLRWHLLHNDAQKCGTAQIWGSCCPTCQTVSMTSPPPLSCDSTTLTTTITTAKLKPEQMQMMHCTFPTFAPHLLFPTSASLSASPSPREQLWPIYLWCISVLVLPVQTCWCTAFFSSGSLTGAPLALQ